MNKPAYKHLKFYQTIRGRVLLFVALLACYTCYLFIYSFHQKEILLDNIKQIDVLQEAESVLVAADLAVFDAITQLLIVLDPMDKNAVLLGTHEHFNLLTEHYQKLSKLYPERAPSFFVLISSLAKVVMSPSIDDLRIVKYNLEQHKVELNGLIRNNLTSRKTLFKEYKEVSDQAVTKLILLTIIGLILMIVFSNLFFGKVALDIKRVLNQITDIVARTPCPDLSTTREDEIGELIRGVNDLSNALDVRERQLHLERIDRSYYESVGAIEKLTTGLVHELGNPIAAINGVVGELERDSETLSAQQQANISLIKDYCDRLQLINNDLAYLAAPTSKEFQLIDLNSVIGKIAGLLHYDERWYGVDIQLLLAPTLPAINACDGQLKLLLNSLLVNSLEAKYQEPHQISIETNYQNNEISLLIRDNGRGMEQATLDKACAEYFTTKAPEVHSGMGLFSCISIVKNHGGHLTLESELNQGTEVLIVFSLEDTNPSKNEKGELSEL